MAKKNLMYLSLFSAIILLILHLTGLRFHLYWAIKWYDFPVHLVGGFWFSITILWIVLSLNKLNSISGYRFKAFIFVLLSALAIGIVWECFELFFNITSVHNVNYMLDFARDIGGDLIGGMFAFLYFIKRKDRLSGIDYNLMVDTKL
jgi:hypothetical protein